MNNTILDERPLTVRPDRKPRGGFKPDGPRGAAGGVRHCRRPQVLLRVVPVGPDLDIVPGSGLRPGQLRLRLRAGGALTGKVGHLFLRS